ncbi:hypothetical protein G7054_g8479 [Neopestalotiopsis clavispora]|nr:hypothetical protein G7054_g8479 [Neopestalotiopsis clavispora]
MSGTGSHRRSLTEEIHRMTYNATEEDFEFLDEISRDDEEASGFRHHAFRTQSDQNLILRMYEGFCQMRKRLPLGEALERMDEKDKQLAMFPKDLKLIAIYFKEFIIYIARKGSGTSSPKISYLRLAKYRLALLFWTNYVHDKYDIDRLPKNSLFHKVTEGLRLAAKRYNLITGTLSPVRSEVGLPELRQLIDHDMLTTSNIASMARENHPIAIGVLNYL